LAFTLAWDTASTLAIKTTQIPTVSLIPTRAIKHAKSRLVNGWAVDRTRAANQAGTFVAHLVPTTLGFFQALTIRAADSGYWSNIQVFFTGSGVWLAV
jgi:hypothetical protein